MKYKSALPLLFLTGLLFIASTKMAYGAPTTINYGNLTLTAPFQATSWSEVWDLTKGDLTLTYTIDQTHAGKIGTWDNVWTEVGLRGEGAGNYNPGLWNTYQGSCGGWMSSGVGSVAPTPGILGMSDKFNLDASGGRGEGDYDLLNPLGPVQVPPIGSGNNYGIWFDRDTVDPWQDDDPLTPAPGGSAVPWGSHNGQTYNTGGIYEVIVQYHALDAGLGSMFATVNGIPTGFYLGGYHPGQPDYYPAGLSFKGDMKHMQVFAGIWAPDATYGYTVITDLTVTGELGISDPLIPSFTYTVSPPYIVHFIDTTHGGMPPYSYSWDFGDATPVSTAQNPTHTYAGPGSYTVKLTVTPFRCVTKSTDPEVIILKVPVGGETVPLNILQFPALWIGFAALLAIAASFVGIRRIKKRQT